MLDRSKLGAIGALLLSTLIMGGSFVILKIGLQYASAYSLLVDRVVVAFLAIGLLKITKVVIIEKISSRLKTILFLLSLLYPTIFFLFQNLGMKYITASETAIMYALIPILTPIASTFILKEKTTALQYFGITICLSGMMYIIAQSFEGASHNLLGYILILSSIAAIVLYYTFLKKTTSKLSTLSITYYLMRYAAASIVTIYVLSAFAFPNFNPDVDRFEQYPYILTLLYLGVLSTLGTSFLTNVGIKYLSIVQTAILYNLSPLFGIVAGVAIMGDILKTYHFIGAVLVFIGIFICLKFQAKKTML